MCALHCRLIDALIDASHAMGCYKVILDCAEKNVSFYEKCGLTRKEIQMVGLCRSSARLPSCDCAFDVVISYFHPVRHPVRVHKCEILRWCVTYGSVGKHEAVSMHVRLCCSFAYC